MKEIPLTQGKTALVSDHQFERVRQFKWHAVRRGTCWYAERKDGRSNVYLHRFLMGVGDLKVEVDHIDGNGLNCQDENMRVATHAQNAHNYSLSQTSTTGFKGVCWKKSRRAFRAQIKMNNRDIHLGYFDDPIDAARGYDRAAKEHFGEFAKLNFPDGG